MSDGRLPLYEELVSAREALSRIIEGIEAGVFGVLVSGDPPLLEIERDESPLPTDG